ncbi:polypeptide N-acetylgalactosaminyltransferase 13 [Trichonephila clavipes]|nr:polypeptide N-acetylgalactosaminyltransferase 13 [Trichonephila clavipes]
MDWPAYSPDLNPIEHVWDMFGRQIAARQPPPTCLQELRRALLDEWCNIPQGQIDNLILSMPRRSQSAPPAHYSRKKTTQLIGSKETTRLSSMRKTTHLCATCDRRIGLYIYYRAIGVVK